MTSVQRHFIDQELAQEGVETRQRLLASLLESAASQPQALTAVLSSARAYAGYQSAVLYSVDSLCSALRTGARAADALYALAKGSGEVEMDLGTGSLRLQATGATDATHPGNWRNGWWLSQIVGD